jgi:hypothetical protein
VLRVLPKFGLAAVVEPHDERPHVGIGDEPVH